MKSHLFILFLAIVSLAALGPSSIAANLPASTNPAAITPRPEDVKATLDSILLRLQDVNPLRVVDTRTHQPITDFSMPVATAALDQGENNNYRPLIYPMGVIHSGMLLDSEITGDAKFGAFTNRYFRFISDTMPKVAQWPARENPFAMIISPRSLDYCGAMGTAMIVARHDGAGPDMKATIDLMAAWESTGQMRLDDGTFARTTPVRVSVWADDMYMSVPILAHMGWMTGDATYYDDAVKQVLQMSARLYVPAAGLYTHGWNSQNPDNHQPICWGRANGWCMMAMAELLDLLPEDHPGRTKVLEQFRAAAKGIAAVQSDGGLWHQLLDDKDSFLETSASAMFTFAIARRVNRGWLDAATFGPVAKLGWAGLQTRITPTGHVLGTSPGTNYGGPASMYLTKPPSDDVHGYGPVLLAGAEIFELASVERTGKPWPGKDYAWPIKSDRATTRPVQ